MRYIPKFMRAFVNGFGNILPNLEGIYYEVNFLSLGPADGNYRNSMQSELMHVK